MLACGRSPLGVTLAILWTSMMVASVKGRSCRSLDSGNRVVPSTSWISARTRSCTSGSRTMYRRPKESTEAVGSVPAMN